MTTRKLTYWVAVCENDSEVYNIRTATRREGKALLAERASTGSNGYGPLHKVTVEYDNPLDLLIMTAGEGGRWWEV